MKQLTVLSNPTIIGVEIDVAKLVKAGGNQRLHCLDKRRLVVTSRASFVTVPRMLHTEQDNEGDTKM